MDYKNIFITGATGVVGKPLLQKLKDHNHNIYALTRKKFTRLKRHSNQGGCI